LLTGMRGAGFINSFREAAMATGSILLLLIAAQLYSRMLALSGVVRWLGDAISGWGLPSLGVVVLFVLLVLVLGAVLDSSSILLLTIPLFFPVIELLGIDPLWFGIVIVVAVEVGLITPPFGMIPFAMAGVLGKEAPLETVFRGSLPFVLTLLVFIALLITFPSLSTWLPALAR
jgi:C4-dicarboxylate transporter DctM subunit